MFFFLGGGEGTGKRTEFVEKYRTLLARVYCRLVPSLLCLSHVGRRILEDWEKVGGKEG